MINILIAVVSVLFIATFVQIIRVSELLSDLKGKDVNEVTEDDNKTQSIILLIVGFAFIVFVIWQMIKWNHFILPPASSIHGEQIDTLMSFTMTLILVVFFILTPMFN